MRQSLLLLSLLFLFNQVLKADLIAKNQDNLKEKARIAKQLNKKLEDLADDILAGQKKLAKLSKELRYIQAKSKDASKLASKNTNELRLLTKENKSLLMQKNAMQGKLINLIAKDFAYDLALPNDTFVSPESVIVAEVIDNLDVILKDEFAKLSKKYSQISKLMEYKQKKITSLNAGLKSYKSELLKLEALKTDQEKELKIQKANKILYAKKIDDLEKQQIQLRKTLAKLQIIKDEERKKSYDKNTKAPRLIGSGYGMGKVKNYTGPKTSAPLSSFSVKQRFGRFIDPIYKIKIFNENVILRSNEEDAPVKSVLAGKVVFAKQTPILQNVVIIEHANGIHTIYAHLERIAPTIKAGRNIRKGYIIGRVKRDLTFEVTQQNYHINPLQLIR